MTGVSGRSPRCLFLRLARSIDGPARNSETEGHPVRSFVLELNAGVRAGQVAQAKKRLSLLRLSQDE
jgi:hypothetical protein